MMASSPFSFNVSVNFGFTLFVPFFFCELLLFSF